MPSSGVCACGPDTVGAELGCFILATDGHACAGVHVCGEDGFSECGAALDEVCNLIDDDCDEAVDEDCRDASGLYVSRLACGSCATPCVEPGANMVATCSPDAAGVDGVRCDVVCEEGFVDVDRILANGCECERFDGSGPPPVVGGDGDCDGVPDDTTDFVYVTTTGSDTTGLLARPCARCRRRSRAAHGLQGVLVATGTYAGFDVVVGVSIFGGYSPDFTDRDLDLPCGPRIARRARAPALRSAPCARRPASGASRCTAPTRPLERGQHGGVLGRLRRGGVSRKNPRAARRAVDGSRGARRATT